MQCHMSHASEFLLNRLKRAVPWKYIKYINMWRPLVVTNWDLLHIPPLNCASLVATCRLIYVRQGNFSTKRITIITKDSFTCLRADVPSRCLCIFTCWSFIQVDVVTMTTNTSVRKQWEWTIKTWILNIMQRTMSCCVSIQRTIDAN